MRALVMAAGLGTRLRPLTDHCPKPLVKVKGRPMIVYVLELLALHGVKEALINIHYLPDQMKKFVRDWNEKKFSPVLCIQDESREILGSGGAVSLAADWLFEKDSTAIICNSDVISFPNLTEMVSFHQNHSPNIEMTMALIAHPGAGVRYNGVKKNGDLVVGFEKSGIPKADVFHFPGFYLIEKECIQRLPQAGLSFSIVDELWKKLIVEKKMAAWVYSGDYFDLGTPEDLKEAESRVF